jgi:hypothetical protein
MTASGYGYVASLFPEVDLISDEVLRQAVANTWLALLESSEYERIEDCPYSLDPKVEINLVEHIRATTRAVIAVADVLLEVHAINLDRDRLLSAILLHDASKLLEWSSADGRKVKSPIGELFPHSYLAGHYAMQQGIDPIVAHLIISHTSATHHLPRFPEGVVIHYVDMVCADIVRAVRDLPLHLRY